MQTAFSVIIPTYNAAEHVTACLQSLVRQNYPAELLEILLIDDCSEDSTLLVVEQFAAQHKINLNFIPLTQNNGPGTARNAGLAQASLDWVLFLDSDDELLSDSLNTLDKFIQAAEQQTELIGFDWTSDLEQLTLNSSPRVGRRDAEFFSNKDELIKQYLSHRMDGSVIYTAFRRDLLEKHTIRFGEGVHEDVDFIFKAYFHARLSLFCNAILYKKQPRENSIINSISEQHIHGYFRAWFAIRSFLDDQSLSPDILAKYMEYYLYGSIGAIATRVREVIRHRQSTNDCEELLLLIYTYCNSFLKEDQFALQLESCRTSYGNIASSFIKIMSDESKQLAEKAQTAFDAVQAMAKKSWSCTDLHHSVFLRPDQVRTCCKRFFVDGEMKGDVVLFDLENDRSAPLSSEKILHAKRDLHQKINSGVASDCDGCPFLEFKNWTPLNTLDVHYLSFEYHSVCNLECSYCDEEYYGGLKASFNLKQSIKNFLDQGVLENCNLVVWGGGEPVIGEDFDNLVETLANKLPSMQQRVLTNAVKTSASVENLLKKKKGQIVTSVDAGSDDVFLQVRGRKHLKRVCRNLQSYSKIDATRVTIKYIFTEGNGSPEDIRQFVELMTEYGLLPCTFQISGDFKNELINPDTANTMMLLFGLLRKAGAETVYFDELLWHRLSDLDITQYTEFLHAMVGINFIANPKKFDSVVVWGAGQQAKYLLEKSDFFKHTQVAFFVDATPAKQGEIFYDKEIRLPDTLAENDLPVVIAAVQGYPLILEQYHSLGFTDDRLIQELII